MPITLWNMKMAAAVNKLLRQQGTIGERLSGVNEEQSFVANRTQKPSHCVRFFQQKKASHRIGIVIAR